MKKRREAIITVAPLACLVLAVLLGVGSYTVSAAMGGFAVFMLIASFVLSLVNAIRYCIIINDDTSLSSGKKSAWIILVILFAYITPVIYRWIYVVKKKDNQPSE